MKPEEWDVVSKDYFSSIQSPFKNAKNPLPNYLKTASGKAIDLGCGIGNLIPFIKDKFKEIYCIDFSQGMINQAKQKHQYDHIIFKKMSITELKKDSHNKFDYVFAINSILEPSIKKEQKLFKKVFDLTKPGGTFIGVFPAMESDVLRATITTDNYIKSNPQDKAINYTHMVIGTEDYDLLLGYFENEGKQKHYYQIQLEYRLKQAGFKSIIFDKVLYPWKYCADENLKKCKESLLLFDWFVKALK